MRSGGTLVSHSKTTRSPGGATIGCGDRMNDTPDVFDPVLAAMGTTMTSQTVNNELINVDLSSMMGSRWIDHLLFNYYYLITAPSPESGKEENFGNQKLEKSRCWQMRI